MRVTASVWRAAVRAGPVACLGTVACLGAVACGSASEASDAAGESSGTTGGSAGDDTRGTPEVDTKPWDIETDTTPPPPNPTTGESPPGGTTDDDDDDDDDGDDDDDDDVEETGLEREEEDFLGWLGFGAVEPGVSYALEGELIIFVDGEDECVLLWTGDPVEPSDACPECDLAFSFTIAQVEVEVDEACAEWGYAPQDLPGQLVGVGLAGRKELFVDFGDGEGFQWTEGWGEYLRRRGELEWALPLQPR